MKQITRDSNGNVLELKHDGGSYDDHQIACKDQRHQFTAPCGAKFFDYTVMVAHMRQCPMARQPMKEQP